MIKYGVFTENVIWNLNFQSGVEKTANVLNGSKRKHRKFLIM